MHHDDTDLPALVATAAYAIAQKTMRREPTNVDMTELLAEALA